MFFAEYIWIDGNNPTKELRSKTKVIKKKLDQDIKLSDFPDWGFDGSSTYQATGDKSDLILKPVNFFYDPLRGSGNYLVLCEVYDAEYIPLNSNTRAQLRSVLSEGASKFEPWIGFEQEYTIYKDGRPLGWPQESAPKPQGPYYCGVGADKVFGRELIDDHADACLKAGLMLAGTNAEVMPGQWEFQLGYRGLDSENPDPLSICDQLWIARWLLQRMGEKHDMVINFDNKPQKGDWNGSGNHTNFSTKDIRDPQKGWDAIQNFINALNKTHSEHIAVYGHNLHERLTGAHETCDINTFKAGERNRGCSIRIPDQVSRNKCGYIEDRRPGANSDPYLVAARLLKTLLMQ